MRKLLVSCFCFWVVTVSLTPRTTHAEAYHAISITVGVKGGGSWVKWYNSVSANDSTVSLLYLPSFTGGVYGLIDWQVAPRLHIGIQPELTFARRGTDTDFSGSKGTEITMDYIEIPLLTQVRFQYSAAVNPFFFIGPRMGILLEARFREPSGATGEDDAGYPLTDFGLSIGFGNRISISKQFDIVVEGRYDVGFVDLAPDNNESDIRNQGLSLLLGANWSLFED